MLVKLCHQTVMSAPAKPSPVLAIALMCCATFFIAASITAAKILGVGHLAEPLHPLQVSFGRFFFGFLGVSLVFALSSARLERPDYKVHMARAVLGWAGVSLMFAAAALIPLSDATAISFTNPIFAMILAALFLSEKLSVFRFAAAFLALAGAILLMRPGASSLAFGGVVALMAAALLGAEVTVLKRLSGHESPLQIILINNAIGVVLAGFAASFVWQSLGHVHLMLMAAVGLTMVTAQAFYVNALKRADVSLVTPVSYGTLIFASLFDLALFDVVPDAVSWIGGALIIAAVLILAWRDALRRRQ